MWKVYKARTLAAIMTAVMVFSNASAVMAAEEVVEETVQTEESAVFGEDSVSNATSSDENVGEEADTGESETSEEDTSETGWSETSSTESESKEDVPEMGTASIEESRADEDAAEELEPGEAVLETEGGSEENISEESEPEEMESDSEESKETATDETLVNEIDEGITETDTETIPEIERMDLQETETEGELIQLDTPTISWREEEDGKIKGYFVMTQVEHCEDRYAVELYKDGKCITTYFTSNVIDEIRDSIIESGVYKLRIMAKGNELMGYADSEWSEFTPDWNYIKPEALPTPEAPQWVEGEPGKISFSLPENAGGYAIEVYCSLRRGGWSWVDPLGSSGSISSPVIFDVSDEMNTEGIYTVTVRALSTDVTVYGHSEESAHSVEYDTRKNNTDINMKINFAIEDMDSSNAVEKIEKLTDTTTANELKIAMQTNESLSNKIETLDNKYQEAMGINVETPVVDEALSDVLPNAAGQIKVVCAALNAKERDARLTLKITPPQGEVPIDATVYHNVVKLDISLDGVNGELNVPVMITMPIPKGVLPDRLRIIHYSDNNTVKEIIDPTIIGDDTVSFVLTSFSNFVFANETDDADKPTTPEEPTQPSIPDDNKPSSPGDTNDASNTVSSSSTSRSASDTSSMNDIQAWKPTTPEDIKRYSYVAAVKPIYTTSVRDATVVNSVQGTKCIEAIEALCPEYTIARTYNIFADQSRGNKVVYQTESPIQITLSIENDLYKAGREFALVSVSKNGEVQIYKDMDENPDTITVNSNTFYAYALVYKDMGDLKVR